ncbi:MFS transporter [Acrocarpospora phusangensis]|uniref:MFS transporter n=1 Tax=Acrocarpospora phusangensis TaxID=1070424 RepID=A0A919QAY3_9ACTN|nr:DHA2 family efflux MFS transporter permease subunit [Acrocarpospora phusangensis]GIH25582.1 MFS transporter [Acrocarpospora phusangensis]
MELDTGHPRRWQILGVMVFSLLAVVLDNTILNVAIKTIADPVHGLGATQSELEWAMNSYTLVFAGLLFTFGVLGDRYGRKRMLLIGMILFGLSSLASAYAQDPMQLILARSLMGIGGAAIMPATLAIISNVFPLRERGKAIGIWAGGVGIAVAIGPITGGLLLEHFWWGSVFLINVPIVLLAVVLIATLVPDSKDPNKTALDPVGVLLSIVGLVSLVYGIVRITELGTAADVTVILPSAAGLLILAGFVWYESRADHPAFDVRNFRDAGFTTAIVSVGLVFFSAMGVLFFMAFYWQIVRGFSPLESGALVLPFAVAQLMFAPQSARVAQRFGGKLVGSVSMLVIALALAGYVFVEADTPLWILLVLGFVQGAAMANIMPTATTAIMNALPREKAGVGSSMSNVVRQVGGTLGIAVLGAALSASYRGSMESQVAGLPPEAAHAVTESIAGAAAVAERLGPQGAALMHAANDAFVTGIQWAAAGSALVALFGAFVMARWMPGKDGKYVPSHAAGNPVNVERESAVV